MAFLIVDPGSVTIRGRKTGTVGFHCGASPNTPIAITYAPKLDTKLGTVGQITAIEFP
jgi:hypothetical protein